MKINTILTGVLLLAFSSAAFAQSNDAEIQQIGIGNKCTSFTPLLDSLIGF